MVIKKKAAPKEKEAAVPVKKVSVSTAKKTVAVKKKHEMERVELPKEVKIKAEPWIKIQTAEGWKRERRKEKLAARKG